LEGCLSVPIPTPKPYTVYICIYIASRSLRWTSQYSLLVISKSVTKFLKYYVFSSRTEVSANSQLQYATQLQCFSHWS
jgi:hypothetical protein